jgi:hypothetical protein
MGLASNVTAHGSPVRKSQPGHALLCDRRLARNLGQRAAYLLPPSQARTGSNAVVTQHRDLVDPSSRAALPSDLRCIVAIALAVFPAA